MCGDPYGWMCDECFARISENPDSELCDSCKKVAECMCFCCMTQSDKPLNGDICDSCKADNGG